VEGVPFVKEGMRKGHLFYRNLNRNIWIFIHNILPVICRFTEFSSIQSFLNLVYMHFFVLSFSIGFFLHTICPFLFLTFDAWSHRNIKLIYCWFIHPHDLFYFVLVFFFLYLCPKWVMLFHGFPWRIKAESSGPRPYWTPSFKQSCFMSLLSSFQG